MKRRVPNLFYKSKNSYPYQHFTEPELGNVSEWELEEYVDGALLRVLWVPDKSEVKFRGEEEDTFIAENIFADLIGQFTHKTLDAAISPRPKSGCSAEIFIRTPIVEGKHYFTLVDIFCCGQWLDRPSIRLIAAKMNINAPGYMGHRSTSDMIDYLSTRPHSFIRNAIVRKVVGRCRTKSDEIIMKFAYREPR